MVRYPVGRGEGGQAVVAAVGVSFVLLALIVTLLAVSVHTNDVTVADRSRAQGVQSAEAGVSVIVDGLSRAVCVPDVGIPTPATLRADGVTVGQYQAMVRLPAEAGSLQPVAWNPNATGGPGCTTAPPATQDRVITAWGYGPHAGSARRVVRKVQVNVRVAPLAGFRFACFAGGLAPDGVLDVQNNMVVQGDCYARTVSNTFNNLVAGTLMTPGTVTVKNNSVFQGNIWAGDAVVLGNNTVVSGYVTSSRSSVHLQENAHVLGNATAATTLTLDNGAAVDGTRCPAAPGAPGCPTNPPPQLTMPVLRCAGADAACWSSLYPGMQQVTSAQLSLFLKTNKTNLQGSFHVSDGGVVDFTDGGTVTGPLTIVTTGKVRLSRDLVTPDASVAPAACRPAPGPSTCIVTVVSTSTASDAIRILPPRFTANPATISVLLYTSGTVLVEGGANPASYLGVVYGRNLTIQSNGMTVTQSRDLVDYPPPFVDWSASSAAQFSVEPVAWRELAPRPPA